MAMPSHLEPQVEECVRESMPNGGSRLTLVVLKRFVMCLRLERKMHRDSLQSEIPAKLFITIIIVELRSFIALC